jgi:hypothetical protein
MEKLRDLYHDPDTPAQVRKLIDSRLAKYLETAEINPGELREFYRKPVKFSNEYIKVLNGLDEKQGLNFINKEMLRGNLTKLEAETLKLRLRNKPTLRPRKFNKIIYKRPRLEMLKSTYKI